MSTFSLFGQTVEFSQGADRYFRITQIYQACLLGAEHEFEGIYAEHGSISNVLEHYVQDTYELTKNWAIDKLYGTLLPFEIYDITRTAFEEACWDLEAAAPYYECIADQYNAIVGEKEAAEAYRAMRKSCRARVVGGGFGLQGAIKGMATAGAINAITGLGHSLVNTVGNIGSAIAASAAKKKLYRNDETCGILMQGISRCITDIFVQYIHFINEYMDSEGKEIFFDSSPYDHEKAAALFENAEKLPQKREELLLRSFRQLPYNQELCAYIFRNYPEERSNVWEIAKFYRIDLSELAEELIEAIYPKNAATSEAQALEAKGQILGIMQICELTENATLDRLERDCLKRLMKGYDTLLPGETEQLLQAFRLYAAADSNKRHSIELMGIWELAQEYAVELSASKKETIICRVLACYKKRSSSQQDIWEYITGFMKKLGVSESKALQDYEAGILTLLAKDYAYAPSGQNDALLTAIREHYVYDRSKKQLIRQKRIWELAKEYHVSFSEKEQAEIIHKFYSAIRTREGVDIPRELDGILGAFGLLDTEGKPVSAQRERLFDLLTGIGGEEANYQREQKEMLDRSANDIITAAETVIRESGVTFMTTSLTYEPKYLSKEAAELSYITLKPEERALLIYKERPIMDPYGCGFCLTSERLVAKSSEGRAFEMGMDDIRKFEKRGFTGSYIVVHGMGQTPNRELNVENLSEVQTFVNCLNEILRKIPALRKKNSEGQAQVRTAFLEACGKLLDAHSCLISYFLMDKKAQRLRTEKVPVPVKEAQQEETPRPMTPAQLRLDADRTTGPASLGFRDVILPDVLKKGVLVLNPQEQKKILLALCIYYGSDSFLCVGSIGFDQKVQEARSAYACCDGSEIPLLLAENSAMGFMKDGFLLTSRRLYSRYRKCVWELDALQVLMVSGKDDSFELTALQGSESIRLSCFRHRPTAVIALHLLRDLIAVLKKEQHVKPPQAEARPAVTQPAASRTDDRETPVPQPAAAQPTDGRELLSLQKELPLLSPGIGAMSPYELSKTMLTLQEKYRAFSCYVFGSESFDKTLPKMIRSFAPIGPDEKPLVLRDTTLFSTGKEGFLLTNRFLYLREMLSSPFKFSVEDISQLQIVKNSDFELMITAGKLKFRLLYTSYAHEARGLGQFLQELLINLRAEPASAPVAAPAPAPAPAPVAAPTPVAAPAPQAAFTDPQALITLAKTEADRLNIEAAYGTYSLYTAKSPDFPKKLRNASAAYAPYRPDETPILLQDSTLFGSAKEGFVMTDKTFYVKQMLTAKTSVPVLEVLSTRIRPSSGLYYLDLRTRTGSIEIYSAGEQAAAQKIKQLLDLLIGTIRGS